VDQLAAELDRESVEMMVRDYIVDLPLRLTEMEELAGAAKVKDLERSAHSLKGISATFGLEELSNEFRAVEEAVGQGNVELFQANVEKLQAATDRAIRHLQAWLLQATV